MSHEAQIHPAQTKILRELLFIPSCNFAKLQKVSGLESDHAKFHIKRLVELGYVDKLNGKYILSIKGKEYANKLDTDAGVIERQPKIAVMLVVERIHNGDIQYLLQERTKHPYYGYWGPPTGKVRWGETIIQTAQRELKEETGLFGDFEFRGVNHEIVVHDTTGEVVEDKIFNLMFCNNSHGKLIERFDGGNNKWRSLDDMKSETKKYKSFDQDMNACIKGISLQEVVHRYTENEF